MATFDNAYWQTMGHEGGYANNALDSGGETYKGVARNFNPKWPGWIHIDRAKQTTTDADSLNRILGANEALQTNIRQFYKTNYWDALRLDQVTSQELAEKLFDMGVNMGIGRVAKLWQEALNLTNRHGRAYADMTVDGVVGNLTLERTNGHYRPVLLLQVVRALQAERYLNIMRNNPTQEAFANSWFSRV